ncbi:hypothetical protein [Streptomyces sp. NPDC093093]|uniref:hypothetical protein n=1 Tax=Streptomyces sp. NPDC093093 TaxID=3366025 RepID=UPI003810170F
MENSFSDPSTPDAAHALAALDTAAESRARMADRITSPWWYHGGLGLAFALAFASMSLRMANWAVGPFILVVFGLGWALRRSTGVSMDRYLSTPGASQLFMAYVVALAALAATGMYLEWGADVRWAIAGAGVLIGALTTGMGFRIDAAARRDLRAGR